MQILESTGTALKDLRIAIVHYWFIGRAGGERVVEALSEMLPQADLFSLVANPSTMAPALRSKTLHTSFLQRVPGATRFHRHLLFLHPLALEQFDLSNYDLVISSESGPAKGVITSSRTCHVCYCHSPMRYIWEMYPTYRRSMNPVVGLLFSLTAHYMRLWDYATAARVDYFVANSKFIASRIRKYYGRESEVIHPPVDVTAGDFSNVRGDYYVVAGRLVDYKRFDIAIEACNQLGRSLTVIGDGPEYKRLKRMAGPSIHFLGKVSDRDLRTSFAGARALLFPGEEDFGIIPVEAQSCGCPVIAYSSGGALETVRGELPHQPPVEEPTGVFFDEQSPSQLAKAILQFESQQERFSPPVIRRHAMQFDSTMFRSRMEAFLCWALEDFNKRGSTDRRR